MFVNIKGSWQLLVILGHRQLYRRVLSIIPAPHLCLPLSLPGFHLERDTLANFTKITQIVLILLLI